MSRIRTVKPEFWTSEQILSCSLNARLLFIGMWNFCDDNGVHTASYVRLKTEVFPADDFSPAEIKKLINELIQNNLLCEYEEDNALYWMVTGWKKHQRIDKPTSRYPLPQSELNKFADHSLSTIRGVNELLDSPPQLLHEPSTTEWNGKERSRKDINMCEVETSQIAASQVNSSIFVEEIFQHWQVTMDRPKARLDKKRQNIIKSTLKSGYTPAELKQAIDGCAKTPYNMGKNDRNQTYNDISLIFRDADHIERFINNAKEYSTWHGVQSTDDLMAGVI
ncbi:hypothetical protein Lste_2927 [Legionella steelei]|uniref:Uncharacterized protein n=1 Tax=Legionella steelei TaxID=947033 RepID=A0A0W0ZC49_9GAMM|nr:hypothetical protein [Legionella steelei]KTD66721.1 hypothetical protein Lste_2927 [Legionella steelei]